MGKDFKECPLRKELLKEGEEQNTNDKM